MSQRINRLLDLLLGLDLKIPRPEVGLHLHLLLGLLEFSASTGGASLDSSFIDVRIIVIYNFGLRAPGPFAAKRHTALSRPTAVITLRTSVGLVILSRQSPASTPLEVVALTVADVFLQLDNSTTASAFLA